MTKKLTPAEKKDRRKARPAAVIAKVQAKVGRPAYQPTKEERDLVAMLARVGYTQEQICKTVKMDETTLRKHFREELDEAHGKAVAEALDKGLLRQAIEGNVTAAIFIAKTRAGWREAPTQLEVKQEGGVSQAEKLEIVNRVLALMAPKPADPIDITPPKVIDHE